MSKKTEIIDVVEEIVNNTALNSKEKIELYSKQYSDMYEKYPILIQSACEDGFDIEKLKWMIKVKSQIDNKEISSHDGNVKVGEHLVDSYIKPKLEKK